MEAETAISPTAVTLTNNKRKTTSVATEVTAAKIVNATKTVLSEIGIKKANNSNNNDSNKQTSQE